ncbi:MAG: gliding motility-associated C-terminal domain-containing protein [Bacteroidales bacterium]|nr:gliding motility-associated C-terminal domain-containing protein [Bacteroidales bacterium]
METEVACDSFTWHGTKYTESGTYEYEYTNDEGCPSTDTLHLTINYGTHGTETELACDSFTWYGTKYTESGTYEYEYTNDDGCPSADTLHLTINYGTHGTETELACDSFTWHGMKYIESGTYTYDYTNDKDCPSTDTLHLTINHATHNTETEVACDSFTWHGTKYIESGTYEYDYTNDVGCPSTDTLHLTINYGTHRTETEVACDSFTWHGTKYTESGIYEYNYTNDVGCPSTDTLHLTINYGTHDIITRMACDSFFWHGTKYTESGTYPYDYENEYGCPSADTLRLTINYTTISDTTVVACESYVWYNERYTESGDYERRWKSPIPEACDRVARLHLTILDGPNLQHTPDTAIFAGASITLRASGANSLTWMDENGTEIGSGESLPVSPETATKYYIQGEDENGCQTLDSIYVTITGFPDNVDSSDCSIDAIQQPWDTRVLYTVDNVHTYFVPLVGDIDGDGVVEIVAAKASSTTTNRHFSTQVGIYRGTDLRQLATISLTQAQRIYAGFSGPMALVRYPNGAGGMQGAVILHCYDNKLRSYDINGQLLNTSDVNTPCEGTISLADFNQDGYPEVYIGNAVYDAATLKRLCAGPTTGNMGRAWRGDTGDPNRIAMSFAANVMEGPAPELICGNTIYKVNIASRTNTALNSVTELKTIDLPTRIPQDGNVAVADFDMDGHLDVLVIADKTANNTIDSAYFYAYNPASGRILFTHGQYAKTVSYPMIGDIDGDNNLEFIYIDEQTNVNNSRITAMKYTTSNGLQTMWRATHTDGSGRTSMTLFDFNQDNIMEIVYRDENNLRIINGSGKSHVTGNDTITFYDLYTYRMSAGTRNEYPVIADVNDDGSAEIVVCGRVSGGSQAISGQLVVLGGIHTWAPARKVWNQYMYNVTNINEDLTVPKQIFNNSTVFTDPEGVERRPYNNFLQQATVIDQYGKQIYAVPDAEMVDAELQFDADSITVIFTYCNKGDNTLIAPYPITAFSNEYGSQILKTIKATEDLPVDSCTQKRIRFSYKELCELSDLKEVVVTVNCEGRGIAQNGGLQPECDTLNNSAGAPIHLHTDTTRIDTTACEYLIWFEDSLTQSSEYQHILTNEVGCDSVLILHLTINHGTHNVDTLVACDSLTWHDTKYTESGVYTFDYENEKGCPSTDTLHLTINYGTHNVDTLVVCDSLIWHETTYKESGDYTFDYNNEDGCPSTDTLHLTVFYSCRRDTAVDVCKNELPFIFMDTALTRSDEYEFKLKTEHGCDSIIVLHLTVYLDYNRQKDSVICDYELPIIFMDSLITEGGDYEFKKKSVHGCDSVVTLHLTVNQSTHNVTTEIACDSLTWNDKTYTESGTYTYDYDNETGCPSTDTLHLTVHHSTHEAITETACDFLIWHGIKYTESGTYEYDYINDKDCPSTDTLHLTINYGTHNTATEVACDSFTWHGTKYMESGTYEYDYTNDEGCPSTDTLHLTINKSTHNAITETACDSLTWHDTKYTESGTYEYDYENENGCPSTDTLHLTVHHSTHNTITETACDSLFWHDSKYTESGTYEYDYTNDEGCLSTDTLHLTIYKSVELDTMVVLCEDELPIVFMDSMITEDGNYEFLFKTIHGCDSVVALHLSVQPAYEQDTTVVVCDYELPYLFADSVLTERGDYEFRQKSFYGCDSLVMVHFEINPSPTITLGEDQQYCSAEFVSAHIEAPSGFESYKWSDGSVGQFITVYAGGHYSVQVTDGNRCTASDTIEIILIENPEVDIQMQPEDFCIHESAVLTAVSSEQDVNYLWNTGETTSYIEISKHGVYSVLVDNQGCQGGDTITIAACDCDIWVPNAFTPNDDALNDRFEPIPSATLGYFHVAVYNRFGELIFQTKDINEGWDGTFKGKPAPLGVYSYVIHYACKAHPEFIILKKGSVTLVR